MSGRRTKRVAAELHRALQAVIAKGLQDPRARGLITVTEVDVSGDLRDATIKVSVFPHDHEELTLHALKDAARHLRREAGDKIALARAPELHFKLDHAMRKQAEVVEAIARDRRERPAPPPAPDDDPPQDHPEGINE